MTYVRGLFRRRGRRISAALAFSLLALCFAGCSSVYMKGTPLYTGDYSKPQAPAEDRVNLWPLAYYHDPALSVLWPLGERTDDHIAARPLFSAYKLDKEKHQYNVLWPLSQFDFDESHYHVAPFFWGGRSKSKYRGMFPLLWYWPGDRFVAFPVFWWGFDDYVTVFPLVWYDSGESFTLFPVLWIDPGDHYVVFPLFWHYPQDDFSAFLPLYTWDRGHNGYSVNLLWPLIHAQKNDQGRGWHAGPLAGDYKWRKTRYRFLLWPFAHEFTDGDEKSRIAFPLYFGRRERNEGWDLVPPLFFRSYDPDSSLIVSPLYSGFRENDEAWRLAFPFFFQSKTPHGKMVLTPLVGRDWSGAHSTWAFVPALSLFSRHGDRKSTWLLGPMSHFNWGGAERTSHVFPLYLYDDNDVFLSLPYSWFDRGESRDHWFLGPLAHARTGKDPRSYVFPFYYHDRGDGIFLSLPYSHTTAGSHHRDHWLLGPLAGFRTGAEHRSHLFPLYMWDKAKSTFLTLPLSIQSQEKKGFVNVVGPVFHYGWKDSDRYEWHAPWPFVGGYRETSGNGFHAWPIWWRKAWSDGSRVKGGALWPLVWFDSSPFKSEAKFFPLFSSSRRVTKTRFNNTEGQGDDATEREYRHRSTWVLPTFTYDRREWNPPISGRGPKGPQERPVQDAGESLRSWVRTGFWPLWRYEESDKVTASRKDFSLLGWLYDSKRIVNTPEDGEEDTYLRRRILWRGMHYERQDGRSTLDVFPFITHDREPDTGFRKTSFAWRLFRYERGRDGSVKTDVLFIPVWRGKGDAAAAVRSLP